MFIESETIVTNKGENQSEKQYFINEENFQLLRQYQQLIFEATEFSPAIRKLVNELINVENLEKIRSKYVNFWKNRV